MGSTTADLIPPDWHRTGGGSRYLQLHRLIGAAIQSGRLAPNDQLPPERELAILANVSRVTVRKAVAQLVADGLVEQRHGAGSFVRGAGPKLEQSLSTLVSFTENMQARGKVSSSVVLSYGLFAPNPTEMIALGLSSLERVARIHRLRSDETTPIALEFSSLPEDVLPNPDMVEHSLYSVLRANNSAPMRAIQRVTAINLEPREAALLKLPTGSAVLKIDRTGYLASGRPIEFTSGFYRSDIYDFVSELRRD